MQGYVNQSPVKQLWLPLNYEWLAVNLASGPKFKDFAIKYKEVYGIDLHDFFELIYDDTTKLYHVKVKIIACIGGYNPSIQSDDFYSRGMAFCNVIQEINNLRQTDKPQSLILLSMGVINVYGYGIRFMLEDAQTPVSSIDDLYVEFVEI